jgi:hypothetical protein
MCVPKRCTQKECREFITNLDLKINTFETIKFPFSPQAHNKFTGDADKVDFHQPNDSRKMVDDKKYSAQETIQVRHQLTA